MSPLTTTATVQTSSAFEILDPRTGRVVARHIPESLVTEQQVVDYYVYEMNCINRWDPVEFMRSGQVGSALSVREAEALRLIEQIAELKYAIYEDCNVLAHRDSIAEAVTDPSKWYGTLMDRIKNALDKQAALNRLLLHDMSTAASSPLPTASTSQRRCIVDNGDDGSGSLLKVVNKLSPVPVVARGDNASPPPYSSSTTTTTAAAAEDADTMLKMSDFERMLVTYSILPVNPLVIPYALGQRFAIFFLSFGNGNKRYNDNVIYDSSLNEFLRVGRIYLFESVSKLYDDLVVKRKNDADSAEFQNAIRAIRNAIIDPEAKLPTTTGVFAGPATTTVPKIADVIEYFHRVTGLSPTNGDFSSF